MRWIHPRGFFFCRGLIHQAHLYEYINKLNGFDFYYVWACLL
ncbi:hypothetical protein ES705_39621 [subsurface metagenome]